MDPYEFLSSEQLTELKRRFALADEANASKKTRRGANVGVA
jgi:hypothetical protein